MNFELGKEYIVKVSEEGIIPIEEFKRDRFYDKDNDDLDFLTDEEKAFVVNNAFDKLRGEIEQRPYGVANDSVIQGMKYERADILKILDLCRKIMHPLKIS